MILNIHSHYSLRYGTMPIQEIIDSLKENGHDFAALTDINNTSGIPEFIKGCEKIGIKPIPGVEIRNKNKFMYIMLAKNENGIAEINKFISIYNETKKAFPSSAPLSQNIFNIYRNVNPERLEENELLGIWERDLNKIRLKFSNKYRNKLIYMHTSTFRSNERNKKDFILHYHLRAVEKNTILSKLTKEDIAEKTEVIEDIVSIKQKCNELSFLIKNTKLIGDICSVNLDLKSSKNKKVFSSSFYDDKLLLEKLAFQGLIKRYGEKDKIAANRIRDELQIIQKLGFSSYFLTTWDIVNYASSKNIRHVGRGSGANSIVAYCLNITDVDPIELNLYFERFINPGRTSPPDFDIDFSWKDRDTVLNYIFNKYSKDHSSLLGTMSTFKGNSIMRELGKVYGLPKEEIDKLCNSPETNADNNIITKKITHLSSYLADMPNQRSIHAGGVLISEKPIYYYTALDFPPKNMPTTQWDMYTAEDIGFEKFDILSQRGIGHIKDCIEIIKENKNTEVDINDVKTIKTDKKTIELLKIGETNGCFYIESPAMRGLTQKLKCDNYLSLVAASSIIRPGVAKSGMMKEYIKRSFDPKNVKYIHPEMEKHLSETFGIMVYQEDVIKIGHHFGGLNRSEADILRRAMSGKFRSPNEFFRIKEQFFNNCREKNYDEKITNEVWRQIASFAGYSFSKAHSASYAVESFQSLYLKAHYPLEFMVAVLNNFGGFYSASVYIKEAKRWGATISLPCINRSTEKTIIIGKEIILGFIYIENLETENIKTLIKERSLEGKYNSIHDFINRTNIKGEQLEILIRVGALNSINNNKKELLWSAKMYGKQKQVKNNKLFNISPKEYKIPKVHQSNLELAYDEIELLGFPISINYFDMLKTKFRGEILAKNLNCNIGKTVRMVGELISIKYVKTIKKEWMHFAAWTDVNNSFFDTVHFPQSLKKFPFKGYGVYIILGKVVEEFGFPSIEVEKMEKLPLKEDPRFMG